MSASDKNIGLFYQYCFRLKTMLHTLDSLAGKISPGSGKNSPQGIDNNGNKLNHFNYNTHPYQKPPTVSNNAKVISLNNRVDNSHPQNLPPVVTNIVPTIASQTTSSNAEATTEK